MFSTKRLNEKRSVSAALALAWFLCAPGAAADPCRIGEVQPVQGAAVNARLEVALDDGRLVRLAGLEPTHPAGADAAGLLSAHADFSQWALGAPLELIVLRAGADRWGRLRGRLFLAGAESAGLPSLAQALVEAGHARVDPAGEVRACLAALYGAEARARAARRGLWADPAYAVLDANAPESFGARAGEVAIVQGVVASFGASRGRTYLNLGAGGRGSPALSLSRAQARAFERIGQSPAALVGRTIRARGLLDMRPGPRIQIQGPDAVELLDGLAAPNRPPR